MIEVVLDENGVWEYTQTNILKLVALDAQALAQWKKDMENARKIIVETIRDHVVSNLHGKENPFQC